VRNFLRWDFYAGTGLGVAAHSRLPLAGTKAAKAANLDLIAGAQRAYHALKNRFHHDLAILPRKFRQASDFLNPIGFGHRPLFHPKWGPASRKVSRAERSSPPGGTRPV